MNTLKPGREQLSVARVESAFVDRVYDKMASVYDLAFGPILQRGRLRAIDVMALDRDAEVLEVGVGTGISLSLYPPECRVTGIDLNASMLERAEERVARERLKVRLFQMDASDLRFGDDQFDVVYAPYVISVVPDPVAVLREMHRVCRPGGRLVLLNHFRSTNPLLSRVERWMSPLTVHIGFKADLDREALLDRAGLVAESVEAVNRPPIWSLVTIRKPVTPAEKTAR